MVIRMVKRKDKGKSAHKKNKFFSKGFPFKKLLILFLFCFFVIILLFTLLPSLIENDWVQSNVISFAEEYIHRSISIEEISFSYFSGLKLKGVTISENSSLQNGEFITIKSLSLDFEWLPFFTKGIFSIKKLIVNKPRIELHKYKNGKWNWSDIAELFISEDNKTHSSNQSTTSKLKFNLTEFKLLDASISLKLVDKEEIKINGTNILIDNFSIPLKNSKIHIDTSNKRSRIRINDYFFKGNIGIHIQGIFIAFPQISGKILLESRNILLQKGNKLEKFPYKFSCKFAINLKKLNCKLTDIDVHFMDNNWLKLNSFIDFSSSKIQTTTNIPIATFDISELSSLISFIYPFDGQGIISLKNTEILTIGEKVTGKSDYSFNFPKIYLRDISLKASELNARGNFIFDTTKEYIVNNDSSVKGLFFQNAKFNGISINGSCRLDKDFSFNSYSLQASLQNYREASLNGVLNYEKNRHEKPPFQAKINIKSSNLENLTTLQLRGDAELIITGHGKKLNLAEYELNLKSDNFYYVYDYLSSQRDKLLLSAKLKGDIISGDIVVKYFKGSFGNRLSINASGVLKYWGIDKANISSSSLIIDNAATFSALPPTLLGPINNAFKGGKTIVKASLKGSFREPEIQGKVLLKDTTFSDRASGRVFHKSNGEVNIKYRNSLTFDGYLRTGVFSIDKTLNGEGLNLRFSGNNIDDSLLKLAVKSSLRVKKMDLGGKKPFDARLLTDIHLNLVQNEVEINSANAALRGVGRTTITANIKDWSTLQNGSIDKTKISLEKMLDILPLTSLGLSNFELSGILGLSGKFNAENSRIIAKLQSCSVKYPKQQLAVSGLNGQVAFQGTLERARVKSDLQIELFRSGFLRSEPYHAISISLDGKLNGISELDIKKCNLSIENKQIDLNITGKLTSDQSHYVPKLSANLFIQSQKGIAIMDDIILSGAMGINAILSENKSGLELEGTMDFRKLNISSLPAFELRGITGKIPFNMLRTLHFKAKNRQTKEQISRVHSLLPMFQQDGPINTRIESVSFGNYEIKNVDAALSYRQNILWLDHFQCDLLQGNIHGNGLFDLNSSVPSYFFSASITNVDFSKYSHKKKFKKLGSSNLDSFLSLKGTGTELYGNYNITRISLGTIDDLLLSFDPEQVSPDIVEIRNYIILAKKMLIIHPRSVTFNIQNDNVNINIFLLPLGIQFKTRLPLSIIWQTMGIEE